MRHHNIIKKFGRPTDQRRALLRSLAEGLIRHGKIKTTAAKARATRRFVEKLVTVARRGTLASRRQVISALGTAERAKRLCDEIAPRYQNRPGGYTRIIKLPRRVSDGSPLAYIEFV